MKTLLLHHIYLLYELGVADIRWNTSPQKNSVGEFLSCSMQKKRIKMDKFYLFASLSRGGCGQWTGYYNVDSWSPLRSDRSHCRPDWGSSLCLIQPETLLILFFYSSLLWTLPSARGQLRGGEWCRHRQRPPSVSPPTSQPKILAFQHSRIYYI